MPWKNIKESYPRWYEKNKDRLNKKRRERWRTDEEYRNQMGNYKRKYNLLYRKKVVRALGSMCVICRKKVKLRIHEIHGLSHTRNYHYILNHIKDFILLCWRCHNGVHWLMNVWKLTWNEIVEKFNE